MNSLPSITLTPGSNGSLTISADGTMLTIMSDGSIVVSTEHSLQLAGACLAKLDNSGIHPSDVSRVVNALQRTFKKL